MGFKSSKHVILRKLSKWYFKLLKTLEKIKKEIRTQWNKKEYKNAKLTKHHYNTHFLEKKSLANFEDLDTMTWLI